MYNFLFIHGKIDYSLPALAMRTPHSPTDTLWRSPSGPIHMLAQQS